MTPGLDSLMEHSTVGRGNARRIHHSAVGGLYRSSLPPSEVEVTL